ncbi:MAG: hypothetical protein QGI11_16335 [Nitrospinota bacterium]|jgi:hypothetical protein|nr:hypothetical protein [Nitrospinota bacterium]MDP6280051.1 hypothetical protein [Nitrospinota bacterium]MDP7385138.1 hypothetical protein [Nitrospinota bacterium]
MFATEQKAETITVTLADAAKAFQEGAEEIASSPQEAEILATAALLNYLTAERPELLERPLENIRKAAIVSSLS